MMSARVKAILQALFVTFLWATSWVFIKKGLIDLPPLIFAGLRYILAFGILLVALLLSNARKEAASLSKPMWGQLILLGVLLYAITQGASFVTLAYLPATTTNLLWSFSSIFVLILGVLLLSEKPTWLQGIGLVFSLSGICIYFLPVNILPGQAVGIITGLVGTLAYALSAILGRHINHARTFSPLLITTVSMGVGAIMLMVVGLLIERFPALHWQHWAMILWLALVNTAFAFTLWNHTLRVLTAMESSIINNTMQVWIPLLVVLFLGESLSTRQVAGMALVVFGTLLVQLKAFPKKWEGILKN